MKKTEALSIINTALPSADSTLVNLFLEQSKGISLGQYAYRPYAVLSRLITLFPPNDGVKKVESIEFFDNFETLVKEFNKLQANEDLGITNIPLGWYAIDFSVLPLSAIVSDGEV